MEPFLSSIRQEGRAVDRDAPTTVGATRLVLAVHAPIAGDPDAMRGRGVRHERRSDRHVVAEGLPEPVVRERGLVAAGDEVAQLVGHLLASFLLVRIEREAREHGGRDAAVERDKAAVL